MARREEIHLFVAWVKVLAEDGLQAAEAAAAGNDHPGVSHYWDPEGIGQVYREVVGLPEGTPAWDLYMAFDREAAWGDEPPAPHFWMHQLDIDDGRRLDVGRFVQGLERMVKGRRTS
jgi:hypothetical protein